MNVQESINRATDNVTENYGQIRDQIKNSRMAAPAGWLLLGAGIGALVAMYFDPQLGRTRRAQIKDKAVSIGNKVRRTGDRQMRELGNKMQGVKAEVMAKIPGAESQTSNQDMGEMNQAASI